jgi:hypothetical protein
MESSKERYITSHYATSLVMNSLKLTYAYISSHDIFFLLVYALVRCVLQVEVEVILMSVSRAASIEEHRVYEFQRWQPVVLWGSDYPGHLMPTDPGR